MPLENRLCSWLQDHDGRLGRFADPIPLSIVAAEVQAPEEDVRAAIVHARPPLTHIWPHTYRKRTRRSKPYCLRINGPNSVGLDWEDSVVGAAEAEFRRRGYTTAREVGTREHVELLKRNPDLTVLRRDQNQRDLMVCRKDGDEVDFWIVEAKGKEAGGFDLYCFAEALGQLFEVPADLLSRLLGSERGPGHGLCHRIAQELLEAWEPQGLRIRITLAVLVPFWAPDVVWSDKPVPREDTYYIRAVDAVTTWLETGDSGVRNARTKGRKRFGRVLEHLQKTYHLQELTRLDGTLRYATLVATTDSAGKFSLVQLPLEGSHTAQESGGQAR